MNSILNKLFFIFIIIHFLLINTNCFEEIINAKDLDEITQCFYQEKNIYGEKEEIIYEITNNNLAKTLFIQFKSVESIIIYHSTQTESNTLFTRIKEENNFGNFYFTMDKNIEKYYIKIEISQNDLNNYKICFNLYEGKGNSFNQSLDISGKISSFDVINSGTFPFYINDNLKSLIALRINKRYENFFSISSAYIKAYNFDLEKEMSLYINELYNKGDYQYLICNLDINIKNIKEIIIEINLNLIENEDNNNIKLEIELVDNFEIHFEYQLNIKKEDINEKSAKIYYINLKKYLFKQDLDILFLANNLNNEIFISNSDNFNNQDIIRLNKKFMIINKNYFIKEKYKNINPYLLLIILDESLIFNNYEEIIYNFIFSGGSHELYKYKEDITKDEFFNNKKLLIKSNQCRTNYYINYFTDIENQKIIEHESILGNIDIFYSNKNDLSTNINDYFSEIDYFPIKDIENSIINGDYGIFKIKCLQYSGKLLSYIYSYNKNSVNDIIKFENQKALLYIESNKKYFFQFDEKLKEEIFTFRIRILKKEKGDCSLEINFNNNIYDNTLNEMNFLELKNDKNITSKLTILLTDYYDMINEPVNSLILEIIKGIDIDKNEIIIHKNNIENSILQSNKYLFFEYDQKISTKININLKNDNDEFENISLCIHKGYGVYPYLIKPICNLDELIILKQNEEINLIYENPYLSPITNNININDNPLYISVYSDNKVKFSFNYEKNSIYQISNIYKDIDFNGKEIIELENTKNQPMIYYQIFICQDIDNNISENDFTKPLFNYYFYNNQKYEVYDINTNLYKEYELSSNNPKIIFNSNGILKGKFKYVYGNKNKLKYNDNYSKKINLEQKEKILKISVDPPFNGDMIMNVIIIDTDFENYNGYCELINLYENLVNNNETIYGITFIQKEINNENSNNLSDIEINSDELSDINRKKVKIFVINTIKEFNFDFFYNPEIIDINLKDYITEKEERQNMIRKIIIIIVCIGIICMIFYLFRNCKNKNSDDINYERKTVRLNDGVINESNKLFI